MRYTTEISLHIEIKKFLQKEKEVDIIIHISI